MYFPLGIVQFPQISSKILALPHTLDLFITVEEQLESYRHFLSIFCAYINVSIFLPTCTQRLYFQLHVYVYLPVPLLLALESITFFKAKKVESDSNNKGYRNISSCEFCGLSLLHFMAR